MEQMSKLGIGTVNLEATSLIRYREGHRGLEGIIGVNAEDLHS